jgi:hypothetical protein
MHDLSFVGHERVADDRVVTVKNQFALLDQVEQKGGHVGREHLAGMVGQLARQIRRPENGHSRRDNALIRLFLRRVSFKISRRRDLPVAA